MYFPRGLDGRGDYEKPTVIAMVKIAAELLVFLGDPMFQRANRICLYGGDLRPEPFSSSTGTIPADANSVNLHRLEASRPVLQFHAFALGRHVLALCPSNPLR